MGTSFTANVLAEAGEETVSEVNGGAHGTGVVHTGRLLARVILQNTRLKKHGYDIIG